MIKDVFHKIIGYYPLHNINYNNKKFQWKISNEEDSSLERIVIIDENNVQHHFHCYRYWNKTKVNFNTNLILFFISKIRNYKKNQLIAPLVYIIKDYDLDNYYINIIREKKLERILKWIKQKHN